MPSEFYTFNAQVLLMKKFSKITTLLLILLAPLLWMGTVHADAENEWRYPGTDSSYNANSTEGFQDILFEGSISAIFIRINDNKISDDKMISCFLRKNKLMMIERNVIIIIY
jgi:hypothetical protein